MTERLKQAVEQAALHLTEQNQELLANALALAARDKDSFVLLLTSLDEAKWNASFARSQDKLKRLADQARRAYEAGEVEPLDTEKL
jgi:hypothetical protein